MSCFVGIIQFIYLKIKSPLPPQNSGLSSPLVTNDEKLDIVNWVKYRRIGRVPFRYAR